MPSVTITAKLKLHPTDEQIGLLSTTSNTYTEACNFVSTYIFQSHCMVFRKVNDELYYVLRDRFGLRAQMAQSVIKTVIARYKAIQETQDEWIQPKFKVPQYDLVWNRDYSLTEGVFSLNTLEGRVKVPYTSIAMEHFFDGTWKFGTAKLVFKHGKWFLHVPMTRVVGDFDPEKLADVVGVDLGINFLAVTYDNEDRSLFFRGGKAKAIRGRYKKLRQDLQRRGTASARQKLKRIGSREHRWMQDVNHCVSKALVNAYPKNTLFVLEDLTGIRSATEKVAVRERYVQVSWAFYDLRKKIEYKALLRNSLVVAVDPAYTSQTCPICGHVSKSNRDKKSHSFRCRKCGYRSNDDRIGGMNLHVKGFVYLSSLEAVSTD